MILTPSRGAKDETAPKRRRADANLKGLTLCFVLLLGLGLVVLYAASYYNAQDQSGNALSEVLSQLMGIGLGGLMMLVLSRIDYRILKHPSICGSLLLISLILLALVAVPGIGVQVNGSRRWLRLGPIGFQPSELAKYAMIIYMARALSRKSADISRFFKGLIPLFIVPGVIFFLILLQPNLSTAGSIIIVAVVMVMIAGAKWWHLGILGVGGAALGMFYALSEPYRRARLMSFRDPFQKLSDEGYQLAQSLLAFGSGGLFGMGLGKGRQKFAFLPYPESDFIFAVVGEDMGFMGCLLVIALFACFLFFGLRIALSCEDRFGSLLSAGIIAMIGVQTVMNMAVVIGLMPTTGLPLPFFSAGGTSTMVVMAAVGIVMNVARQKPSI
ncbi:putative lipid II flippase FtsW [Eubacteriales bacterium OttesenSCG-928-N13]|nr:putative lipid II flippase FtsW [Eubacteriales bacterium OttesenSCG-928-N13]